MITVPNYIICIDIIFLLLSVIFFLKELFSIKYRFRVKSCNVVKYSRIITFHFYVFVIIITILHVKTTTRCKWTRAIIYIYTTLTASFFTFQTLYYGLRILFKGGRLLDAMFFVSFYSSIITFIAFWFVIFPCGIFYHGNKFSWIHVFKELLMHGLNVIVPCIEFYYESKTMHFNKAPAFLLMILFSGYCLMMSYFYNSGIIDWPNYNLLPWSIIGKMGIFTICFLCYYIIKEYV